MHKTKPHLGKFSLLLATALGAGIVATTNQTPTHTVDAARSYSKATNQYAVVKKSGYNFWGNFSWSKKLHYSKNYLNHTLQVKRIYYKSNGSKYYSTYLDGKWFGYVNATGMATTKNAQGAGVAVSKYAIMNKAGWKTYSGFNWKTNHYTKNYLKHTFQVKRTYYHANGSTYASLYRGGKWFGYINASALTNTTKKQGAAVKPAKPFTVYLNNIDKDGFHQDKVWRDLNFSKSVYANKTEFPITYTVKTIYYHSNGYTYYSLYQGNKWVGYTNAKNATTQKFTEGEIVVYFKTSNGTQVDLVASDGDTGSTIDFADQVPAGYEAVGNTRFVVQGGKGQVETIVIKKIAANTAPSVSNGQNSQSTGSVAAKPVQHLVTVICKDDKGNVLKAAERQNIDAGQSYTANAPTIDGYVISGATTQTITPTKDSTIVFTYEKKPASTVTKQQIYDQLENEIFADINAYRNSIGVKTVEQNSILSSLAEKRAPQLLSVYDHVAPDGTELQDIYYAAGWNGLAAENIMRASYSDDIEQLAKININATAKVIVQSWIDSPLHRAAMADKYADFAGVGVSGGIDKESGQSKLTFVLEIGTLDFSQYANE